jgi:virginiamycin B lyase
MKKQKGSAVLAMLALATLAISANTAYAAGEVSGTIKGPNGAPLRAVFVRAEHAGTKMTTIVLSNNQGRYRVDNLAPGTYQVWATAVGYQGQPGRLLDVKVEDGKTVSADFSMKAMPVGWHELTKAQAAILLPEAPGKERFMTSCMNCHGMSRIRGRRDHEGWLDAIDIMRRTGVTTTNPAVANEVASYLTAVLGPDSPTPQSPTQMPGWDKVKPVWTDEALNIVYVDYPVNQGTNRPGTGYADKDGNIWMEMDSGLARLNPVTGKSERWEFSPESGVHEALPLPDGSVWGTMTSRSGLARLDTESMKWELFTESYDGPKVRQIDPNTPIWDRPRAENNLGSYRKHTAVADRDGNIWGSGRPLSKFDVKTKQFTYFPEIPDTYGITLDPSGNVWFAEFNAAEYGSLGMVDPKTNKVTKFKPRSPNGRPRRIKSDSKGNIWMGQYFNGSIAKFDPKTQEFTEYKLPGPHPTIYGLGVDHQDNVWGVSHFNEATFRVDPTGRVTMYPSPYIDRSTRDLWPDAQGRMWYGAQVYYKVGYFYLRNGAN